MPGIFNQYSFESVMLALGLTVLALVATGIGSGLAFWTRRCNVRLLAWALAFSAGLMVSTGLDELLPTVWRFGTSRKVLAGITAGMALMAGSLLLLSTGGAQ